MASGGSPTRSTACPTGRTPQGSTGGQNLARRRLTGESGDNTTVIPERYCGYETRLRAGAVDFAPVPADVAANLQKMTGWIAEAADAGVGLLVFPEEALTGAIHCDDCKRIGGPCRLHRRLAETVPGPVH